MIKVRPIFLTFGLLLCVLAAAMLMPGCWPSPMARKIGRCSSYPRIHVFIGGLMVAVGYAERQARLGFGKACADDLSWVVVSAFAAVPFTGSTILCDAYFEAMSA